MHEKQFGTNKRWHSLNSTESGALCSPYYIDLKHLTMIISDVQWITKAPRRY